MNTNIDLPIGFKKYLVDAVSSGVGDDVKKVLRTEKIDPKHSNAKGNSVYDYINRNIRMSPDRRFTTEFAKVNAWNYVPIFDNITGFIYILMKRNRFEELQREKIKKENDGHFRHYVYANTKIINADIKPEYEQISVFLEPEDENKLLIKVENMLSDLHIPRNMVNRFALILFEVSEYELTSICCCIPDSDFKIRYEESWNKYISYQDSAITEVIEVNNINNNETSVGTSSLLGFSKKSRDKIGQDNAPKHKEKARNKTDKK